MAMFEERTIGLALAAIVLGTLAMSPALAADRDQPRRVANLVGAVKAPFGPRMEDEKTERAWRIGDGGVGACLRHESQRWCYEHFPASGLRSEMLQVSVEPLEEREGRPSGPWQYAVDEDLEGVVDHGGYKMRGSTAARDEHYFFTAWTDRGEKHKADVQAVYDEGLRLAEEFLGE